jgi:hypothetical protein
LYLQLVVLCQNLFRAGHTTIVKILLHHSPPEMIKEVDIYGRTPLIQAASGGYVECASLLLDNVSSSFICYLPETRMAGLSLQASIYVTFKKSIQWPQLKSITLGRHRSNYNKRLI